MPDWNRVLAEIEKERVAGERGAQPGFEKVRRKYLKKLFEYTGRNTIAYYSGFLNKNHDASMDLTDADKNAFMMAIHGLDRSRASI